MSKHPNTHIAIHCNRHDIEIEVDHAHELDYDWFTICFSLDALVYVSYEQTAALAQSLLDALQDHDLKVAEAERNEPNRLLNRLNAEASEQAQADEGTVPGLGTEL